MSRNGKRPPLELACFDVGGTLLAEREPRWEIYAGAARRRGLDVGGERMHGLMREVHHALPRELPGGAYRYSDAWFRAFIASIFGERLGLAPDVVADVTEELFACFEDAATFRVYDGATDLLEDLRRRGVRLAVVSNWSARLPRVLAATGLDGFFDPVLCSALERAEKPDPVLFAEALRRTGTRPASACHVGDRPRYDVEGPRRVGIEPILIDHSGGPPPEGYDDVPRVRGFAALARHLLPRLP